MNCLKQTDVSDFTLNPTKLFRDNLALVTVKNGDKINTITVGWGQIGFLWKKSVATIYIRHSRYTYDFIENSDSYSISFFDESYKDKLIYCGRNSGKDVDKITECNFNIEYNQQTPYIAQASTVLICNKLYTQDILPELFEEGCKDICEGFYGDGDLHKSYIGEITNILKK